jgi:tetratricopeptide (TPR) repeat protein
MALFNRILDENLSRPKFTRNQANYLIGEIYFKRNDFKTAQSYFYKSVENTLRAAPDNHYWTYTRGNLRIGECYEIFGQRRQAIPYYKKVLDGKSEWGKDDAEERLEKPMRAIDIELIQASNFRELTKFDHASEILNTLRTKADSTEDDYIKLKRAEIYYQLGRVSFDQKKYPDTIKLLTKALESDDIEPERILYWSHFYLAEAYRYSDNRALAATHYEEAAESEDPRLKIKIKMSIAKMPESELATPQ